MLIDEPLERQPGQVLHGAIERAVLGDPVVEDPDRVGMHQGRRHPDLALEPTERRDVAGLLGPDHLDGAGPAEPGVLGQVDLAHPAGAELPLDVIRADLAGLDRQSRNWLSRREP